MLRKCLVSVLLVAAASLCGSAASAGDITYTYDKEGRVLTASYPNNTRVTYEYDSSGNRTRRVAESCVGAELAPIAVNDVMTVYISSYPVPENPTFSYYYAFGDPVDLMSNDSDPSSFPLTLELATAMPFSISGSSISYSWGESPDPWPIVNSIQYTISNGHCQTDTGTLTINYEYY